MENISWVIEEMIYNKQIVLPCPSGTVTGDIHFEAHFIESFLIVANINMFKLISYREKTEKRDNCQVKGGQSAQKPIEQRQRVQMPKMTSRS